jgi:hypothetical protein
MNDQSRLPGPPLPVTTSEWMDRRKTKAVRTLNDMVEEIHLRLVNNDDYRKYLDAVWDEDAVEGSLSADNYELANLIRAEAIKRESPIMDKKKATIAKALGVVLRRFGEDRKTRRNSVHGEYVPNDSSAEG